MHLPAPSPVVLVGVLTLTKMMSASRMALSISVEKNRFLHKGILCMVYGE